jgi:hypothetical protein
VSELIRIDGIKADADRAAEQGYSTGVNPYRDDPRRSEIWLAFYNARLAEINETEAA